MKITNKKKKLFLTFISIGIINSSSLIYAAEGAPKLNVDEAQNAVLGISEPITTLAMWLIPIITGIVLLYSGLTWLMKDEEEREQKPFVKNAKKIIIVAVFLMAVPVLLRIFGIS